MTQVTLKAEAELKCTCGGTVTLATADGPDGAGAIIHMHPICVQYDALTADDYIKWLLGELQGRHDA